MTRHKHAKQACNLPNMQYIVYVKNKQTKNLKQSKKQKINKCQDKKKVLNS